MLITKAPQDLLQAIKDGLEYLNQHCDMKYSDDEELIKTWLLVAGLSGTKPSERQRSYDLIFSKAECKGVKYMIIFMLFHGFEKPEDNGWVMTRYNQEKFEAVLQREGPLRVMNLVYAAIWSMGGEPDKMNWGDIVWRDHINN